MLPRAALVAACLGGLPAGGVLVRGSRTLYGTGFAAQKLVVMAKGDIAKKQEAA